jgi:hypothetical protein
LSYSFFSSSSTLCTIGGSLLSKLKAQDGDVKVEVKKPVRPLDDIRLINRC